MLNLLDINMILRIQYLSQRNVVQGIGKVIRMSNDDSPSSRGYKTIEEIAAEMNRSAGTIRNLIKKFGIAKSVFPGDNRERVAPEDVERIRKHVTKAAL